MLARIRKAMEEREEGFTLIELLVVMIIIGILAAIAIPVFLSQKQKAYQTSLKSDLHQIATEIQTALVDDPAQVAITSNAAGGITTLTLTPQDSTGAAIPADAPVTLSLSNNDTLASDGTNTATISASNETYCIALMHGTDVTTDENVTSDGNTQTYNAGHC